MRRVLILAEGQTEERFVKDVLQPHFWPMGIDPEPKIATTKRVKAGPDFKGGVLKFQRIEDDLRRLFGDTNAVMVTTLLDFYGFPKDFAGWKNVTATTSKARVEQLEAALEGYFSDRRFRAYLMLHEYEAMLFSDATHTAQTLNEPKKAADLQAIKNACTGPEKIDDGVNTAPSKRIRKLFPGYQKPLHGPLVIGRIGLDRVRGSCPHFHEWLTALEALANS